MDHVSKLWQLTQSPVLWKALMPHLDQASAELIMTSIAHLTRSTRIGKATLMLLPRAMRRVHQHTGELDVQRLGLLWEAHSRTTQQEAAQVGTLCQILVDLSDVLCKEHMEFLSAKMCALHLSSWSAEMVDSLTAPFRCGLQIRMAAEQMQAAADDEDATQTQAQAMATLSKACAEQNRVSLRSAWLWEASVEFALQCMECTKVLSALAPLLDVLDVQEVQEVLKFALNENRLQLHDFKMLWSATRRASRPRLWHELVELLHPDMLAWLIVESVDDENDATTSEAHLRLLARAISVADVDVSTRQRTAEFAWNLLDQGTQDRDMASGVIEVLCCVSACETRRLTDTQATPGMIARCVDNLKTRKFVAITLKVVLRVLGLGEQKGQSTKSMSLLIGRLVGREQLVALLLSTVQWANGQDELEQGEQGVYSEVMRAAMNVVVCLAEHRHDTALLSAELKDAFHRECVENAKSPEVRAMGLIALRKVVDAKTKNQSQE